MLIYVNSISWLSAASQSKNISGMLLDCSRQTNPNLSNSNQHRSILETIFDIFCIFHRLISENFNLVSILLVTSVPILCNFSYYVCVTVKYGKIVNMIIFCLIYIFYILCNIHISYKYVCINICILYIYKYMYYIIRLTNQTW